MSRTSTTLMTSTDALATLTGEKFKGAGYSHSGNASHTIAIDTQAFTGEVAIQGSLADTPTDADWFPIKLDGTNDLITYAASTDLDHYTFNSNLVWVRAVMTNRTIGSINKILLAF